jgi:hypothetical protein
MIDLLRHEIGRHWLCPLGYHRGRILGKSTVNRGRIHIGDVVSTCRRCGTVYPTVCHAGRFKRWLTSI